MDQNYDVIIIGGGPAGLSAAQYAGRANLKVLLVEEMALGGQGLVIESLENYPGFPEGVGGFDFAQKMEAQARQFGAEILNTTVRSFTKEGNTFKVVTGKGDLTATAVNCATCDGPFFKNQKILVVGGGDAACDEAMFLSKLTDQVVMVHRRDRFRAQKALGERVLANPRIDVRFNTTAVEIKGDQKVKEVVLQNTETGETSTEDFGAVFIFVGSLPQTCLVPDLEKDEAGYLVTNQRMETSVPGLYVVGDLRATPFRQVVVAAGEGAVAAHCAAQYIDEVHDEAYI